MVKRDPTTVIQIPDLAIAGSHTGSFKRGDIGDTYTLAVKNVGSVATVGAVTVTDTLPAGLTATAMAGAGWTCALANLTCTRSDALAGGGTPYPVIVLTVNVASNAPASVTNTATVSGGGDFILHNNTSNDATTIQ